MNDTSPHIYKKQYEIIAAKPLKERILMGLSMIDDARTIVENSIKLKNPTISKADLAVEVFKRFYKNDFSPELLNKIALEIYQYHNQEKESHA
jgi:hypothetical protein